MDFRYTKLIIFIITIKTPKTKMLNIYNLEYKETLSVGSNKQPLVSDLTKQHSQQGSSSIIRYTGQLDHNP